MNRKAAIVIVSALLGAGAAFAVGSCGEDRGGVEVEGGTGTTGTGGTTGESGTTGTAP